MGPLLRRCAEDSLQKAMQHGCRVQQLMATECAWHFDQLDANSPPNPSPTICPAEPLFSRVPSRLGRRKAPGPLWLRYSDASELHHGVPWLPPPSYTVDACANRCLNQLVPLNCESPQAPFNLSTTAHSKSCTQDCLLPPTPPTHPTTRTMLGDV
jgi:hypothetical protein